jgi:hypothetical protein
MLACDAVAFEIAGITRRRAASSIGIAENVKGVETGIREVRPVAVMQIESPKEATEGR